MTPFILCFGLVVLLILILAGWRLASRRFSLPCPTWLGWLVEFESPVFSAHSSRAIVERLELQPGMKVLDLGCGPGRVTIPIAERVGPKGEVVAVDIQAGMLRRAQAKAQAAGLGNIRFIQAGVGEGKLGRGEFDRAVLVTVLGEIPDQAGALQEIFEALKPGGLLSVTEVVADPHYRSRGAVLRLASAAGFREHGFFGNRLSFTLNLEKPAD